MILGYTYLETLVTARFKPFRTLSDVQVAGVRGMGAPDVAADAWQLWERQLGDGSRNDRPDQSELNELHTDGPGEPDSVRGETALDEKREKTDR